MSDDYIHPVFAWKIELLANHEAAIIRYKAVPIGTVDPDTMEPDDTPAMAFAIDGMRRLRDGWRPQSIDAHKNERRLQ